MSRSATAASQLVPPEKRVITMEIVLVVLAILLLAMAWQHFRYLRIRRSQAQDQQVLLHSDNAFHLIVYFKLRTGEKVVDTARRFSDKIMSKNKPQLVYAGQAAFSINSQQLGNRDWDGVLLFEYPTRSDYAEDIAGRRLREAREYFADSYVHGMRRNWQKNLAIPQYLLRLRAKEMLLGKWRVEPLQESPVFKTFPEFETWRNREARLRALHEVNKQGLVVYSLIKQGNLEQRAASEAFSSRMASRMAALAHGPLHRARPVALEGRARFDQVYVNYYPSAGYFADLLASQFFQGYSDKKQLADTLAVFTVPITERLLTFRVPALQD